MCIIFRPFYFAYKYHKSFVQFQLGLIITYVTSQATLIFDIRLFVEVTSTNFQYDNFFYFFFVARHTHTLCMINACITQWQHSTKLTTKTKRQNSRFITMWGCICSVNFQTFNLKTEKHFKDILKLKFSKFVPGKLNTNLHKKGH